MGDDQSSAYHGDDAQRQKKGRTNHVSDRQQSKPREHQTEEDAVGAHHRQRGLQVEFEPTVGRPPEHRHEDAQADRNRSDRRRKEVALVDA